MPCIQSPEQFKNPISSRVAADLVGIHYKTLERLARARRVPAAKIGESWIFKKSALNRWLDELLTSNLDTDSKTTKLIAAGIAAHRPKPKQRQTELTLASDSSDFR